MFQQNDDECIYVKSLVPGEAASCAEPRPQEGDRIIGVDDQVTSCCSAMVCAHYRCKPEGLPLVRTSVSVSCDDDEAAVIVGVAV
ncbi:MAG: hypothetical protein ACPIOQ_38340 [Promethearchaeia archaeon]